MEKFLEIGTIANASTSESEQTMENIHAPFTWSLNKSAQQAAHQLHVPKTIEHRVLRNSLKVDAYKFRLYRNLN